MISEINIRCFLSLAGTLNFTQTGNELYLSQQAVSKNIASLEESLGTTLFDRSRHSVSLTEAGRLYYLFFQRVDRELDELKKDVSKRFCERTTLRYGCQNGIMLGRSTGIACSEMNKELSLSLNITGERHSPVILMQLLREEKIDVAIMYHRFLPPLDDSLTVCDILEVPAVLLVSVDHPKATATATWEDFKSEPFIFDYFENESLNEINRRSLLEVERWQLTPSRIIIVSNRDSAYTGAELGQGIICSTRINRVILSSFLARYDLGQNEYITCVYRNNNANKAEAAFTRCLMKELNCNKERYLILD